MNQITEAFSQEKYTLGTYIDLSKAFDTVNSNILLEKLKAYGTQSENLECLEAIYQTENSLSRTKISKQK